MAYEDEEDTEETGGAPGGLGALAILTGGQSYTTQEAQNQARKILKSNLDSDPFADEESAAFDSLKGSAEATRAALREARAKIIARRQRKSLPLLAISAGLAKPTKTGSFAESFGNVSENLIPVVQDRDAIEQSKAKELLGIDTSLAGIDEGLAKSQLDLLKLKRQQTGPLNREALKILGRQVKSSGPGSKPLSPFGKIAQDEGLTPGSTGFNARVKELQDEEQANKRATSGRDSQELNNDEQREVANQYGLPLPTFDPFKNLSTKARTKAIELEQRNAEKRLTELSKVEDDAEELVNDAKKYLILNKKTTNGQVRGRLPGMNAIDQEADSISDKITPRMRQPGSGSSSDLDVKMFKSAVFNRTKDPIANENLAKAFIAQKQRELERLEFFRRYASVYNSLRGADESWKQYLKDNPIFSVDQKNGMYNLNQKRKSSADYFREKNQAGFAEGGEVETGDTPPIEEPEDDDVSLRILQNALQGGTLGFADEAAGLVNPEATGQIRAGVGQSESARPLTSKAVQGAGTAGLLAAGRAAAARAGMSPALIKLLPVNQLLQLALTGAVTGGLGGIGASEGDSTAADALVNAGLGAGGATLAGLLAKYGVQSAEELYDRTRGRAISPADKRLIDSLQKDSIDPADLPKTMAKARRSGVPANLEDVLGSEGRALAEAASVRAGEPGNAAASAKADRLAGSRERVGEAVNRGLKPDEYFGKLDDTIDQLRTNAKPLYDAAYTKYPGLNSPKLQELLKTPAGEKAVKEAFKKMQNAREPIGVADALGMVRKPSLKFFDYVKRALDDQVTSLQSKKPDSAKIVRDLRNSLRDELDNLAPEYKTARAQYAGDLEVRDALKAGREDFSKMTSEEIKRLTANMSFAEKDVFRSGVAQALSELINDPSSNINAARKLIGSPETTKKLEAIFEKPADFKVFKAALDAEASMFDRDRRSVNARERANVKRVGAKESPLEKLDPTLRDAPTSPLQYVLGILRRSTGMSEKTADELVKKLGTNDPNELKTLSGSLSKSAKRLKGRKGRAGKAALLAGAAAGYMSAPSPRYQNQEKSEEENDDAEE